MTGPRDQDLSRCSPAHSMSFHPEEPTDSHRIRSTLGLHPFLERALTSMRQISLSNHDGQHEAPIALSCGYRHCSLPDAHWITVAYDRCLYNEHAISTLIGKFRLFRHEYA